MAGYPSDWDSRRKEVYRRDDYECQNCGRNGGPKGNAELHAHHVVPKGKGGTHRMSNLKTVCKGCHDAIHGSRDAPSPASSPTSFGGFIGHIIVFILFGWWTLGIANILYAIAAASASGSSKDLENIENTQQKASGGSRPTDVHIDEPLSEEYIAETGSEGYAEGEADRDGWVRLGKDGPKKGFWQKRVDKGRNKLYDGCPSCEAMSLTVSWIGLKPGNKVKIVECEDCRTFYEEVEGMEKQLREIESPAELDPADF